MQHRTFLAVATAALVFAATPAFAQQKTVEGSWTGTIQAPQGETPTSAKVTRSGATYTGTINLMNADVPMTNITVVGDTLRSQVQLNAGAGGAAFPLDFVFVVKGDSLTGQAKVDANGQPMSFPILMKRAPAAP